MLAQNLYCGINVFANLLLTFEVAEIKLLNFFSGCYFKKAYFV